MSKKYDVVVFIGRFQPLHNSHVELLRLASTLGDKVICIIGSASQPRSFKNPFSVEERGCLIDSVLNRLQREAEEPFQYEIASNIDTVYDDTAWVSRTKQIVEKHTRRSSKVAIIGHDKDESSFYLKMFMQWEAVLVDSVTPLSATQIRNLYFTEKPNLNFLSDVVPRETMDFLSFFSGSPEFNQILRERHYVENYRKKFDLLDHEPTFVVANAAVTSGGCVILVDREKEPGRGLLALPSCFLSAKKDRSIEHALIRALHNVGLPLSINDVRAYTKESKVFDSVNRSVRGRVVAHSFHIELPLQSVREFSLVEPKYAAAWYSLTDLNRRVMHEDNFDIIQYFIGM